MQDACTTLCVSAFSVTNRNKPRSGSRSGPRSASYSRFRGISSLPTIAVSETSLVFLLVSTTLLVGKSMFLELYLQQP